MRYLIPAALVLAFGLACGGDSKAADGPSLTTATRQVQLGREIGQTYFAMLDDTQAMLALRLPADQLRPALGMLRDDYKVRFANLGCIREDMSESDRAEVDRQARLYIDQNVPSDLPWLNEASSRYGVTDPAIPALLTEVKGLTQYAFFDLLRRQKPGETVTCSS
jgi:hypothetical protein